MYMLSPAHYGHVSTFNDIMAVQFKKLLYECDVCLSDVRMRRCRWRGTAFLKLACVSANKTKTKLGP